MPFAFVVPIQPAPLLDRLVANLCELRLGAIHIAVAAAILAHQSKVAAVDDRRGIPHKLRMANIQIVLVGEVVLARRKLAAAKRWNASVVNLHEVFAEARQIPRGPRAKTFSQTNQQQQ